MKKLFFLLSFFISVGVANGQRLHLTTAADNDIVSKYKHLSVEQLLDTAKYFYDNNNLDEALALYSLLLNMIPQQANLEDQKKLMEIYYHSALSFYYKQEYYTANGLFLETLRLSEISNDLSRKSRSYLCIGNIYYQFGELDLAKHHFFEALYSGKDSLDIVRALINIGVINKLNGNFDDAFDFFNKALPITERHDLILFYFVKGYIAEIYREKKEYDSARHYYHLSIEGIKDADGYPKNRQLTLVTSLLGLGKIFFETNQPDSAIIYANLSNAIAIEHEDWQHLVDGYLFLSQIAESQGRQQDAFVYFKTAANLKDTHFSREKIVKINQLRHSYQLLRVNQEIEKLSVEHQIKQRTIRYQQVLLLVFALVCMILTFLFFQNKKLNTAYKKLFEKNIKLAEYENSTETPLEKYQKSALTDEMQNELLTRIYTLMEDTSVVCDTEFSLDRLAEMAQSNHAYVSQVINGVLKKNFRMFVNGYRVREAQRLFSEPDASKYTIESIAHKAGFNSTNAFRVAFKEFTGVSPGFYLKSMRNL